MDACLRPVDPDHAAFFDRQRQLAVLQRQRRFAEQFAAPAVQCGDVGVHRRRRSASRSSTVAITLLATAWRSEVMRSSTFSSSTIAAPLELLRGFSIFGSVAGSRASPRCTAATMSLPHFERSKPFGSERRLASFSSEVGAWVAISPTASSFSTRRARHVAALRFLLAPGRDFHQHREFLRLAHPRLQPLPGALGVEIVGLRRGQDLHLLADPVAAAALLQVGVERCEHVAQMGDVGDRVMHLLLVSAAGATSR